MHPVPGIKMDSSEKRSNVEPSSQTVATFSEEGSTHSFIVKIWLEETLEEAGKARWRGHITHVPGGERRYFEDLRGIVIFILPYLDSMKVRPSPLWKIWKRLFGPSK
jgi:hypothetical protein